MAKSVQVSDPRFLVMGVAALAAAGWGGSMLGLTIEPESVTDLRVEKAQLEVKVEMLEDVVEQCKSVVAATRASLEDEG